MRFAIEQLQALHHAIACQRNSAAVSAAADYFTYLQWLGLSVAIVNNDAVKLDRRMFHADLQKTIAAGGAPHFNIVMGMLAVNMGLAKISPALRMGGGSQPAG